jgi:predicted alpha/beta hydrolase family esterase
MKTMKKQVLFIQGAGEGAYEEDGELVKSLRDMLGFEYTVLYPKMPNDGDSEYEALKARISEELAVLDGGVILVGHSAGASVLMKYLSEEDVTRPIAGIFLIAAPYFGAGGWHVDDGALHEGFASRLAKGSPIFFYHSRDDEVVPFEHLALYATKLPQATIREFDGRGHQFRNDLSEVAADIKSLQDIRLA